MQVASGHSFFARVAAQAQEIAPALHWVLIDGDGSCSESPEGCDLVVLAGDSYTLPFVETVLQIPAVRWAHTEDTGTDGRFYDAMRARGVTETHSPAANVDEVDALAYDLILRTANRQVEIPVSHISHVRTLV